MTAKLLYLDIETSALNADVWSPWEANAIAINREWQVLGFAYAWGDGKVKSVYPKDVHPRVPHYCAPANEEDERLILDKLWHLLDQADIVVAHNGDKFDLRKINARFIRHFGPPSPYRTVDTLKVARKHFAFTKNRLDYLGEYLGLGRKLAHQGYKMWQGCMLGEKKAWLGMAKYNRQDIVLLRDVYKVMLPWISNHPHVGGDDCPKCGSSDVMRRGIRTTNAGIQKQQYQCNTCGGYHIAGKPIENPTTRN